MKIWGADGGVRQGAFLPKKTFLKKVRNLPCWKSGKKKYIQDFGSDAEVLYATLYSIFEFSSINTRTRNEDFDELNKFAESSKINEQRQRELQSKVRIAGWDARETICELSLESFLDDFVRLCLQDKKIDPFEYKLIYLIGHYLNLDNPQISNLLKKRFSKLRYRAILFFEQPWVSALISFLIILNAIQLGLMTCPWFNPYKGAWFYRLDFAFICIFSVEILCRIFAFRWDFFKESQNIFDFVVVTISWIPSPVFRWASALRIFRAMLLLNRLGQTKSIMRSLLDALPNIGWVTVLLGVFYYVFAVLTTNLFGGEFEAFQSIEKSLFSLFQLMTLESWPELVTPVMNRYPYSWLIFIPFMIITSYIFLNLVIGIIVTSMHDISLKKKSVEKTEIAEIIELKRQINDLTKQIKSINDKLDNIR